MKYYERDSIQEIVIESIRSRGTLALTDKECRSALTFLLNALDEREKEIQQYRLAAEDLDRAYSDKLWENG